MRYVSFRRPDGIASWGRLEGDTVIDLGESATNLRAAIAGGRLGAGSGAELRLADVILLPPIPQPAKILCIGLNYATHLDEMGNKRPGHPTVFTRFADTLVAHGQPLLKPASSDRFDYEGELAVIVGQGGRRIPRERALERIAGFSVFNDASVRDWQRHSGQFTPGKNFPATGGFGPAMVTPDEIDDLASQRVQTRLNGKLLQDQPVSDMLWGVAELVEYLSAFTPLGPGDVIVTGTPGGVGDARKPPLYLQPGDTVEVSIGAVGTLRNTVAGEG
jgi:2-keto-4-pentenoate hydratase/2-oxohepta-3-ene-1,7-dioic acid hydratase in catechol pathway